MVVNIVLQNEAFKSSMRPSNYARHLIAHTNDAVAIDIARYAKTLYQELDAVHKDAVANVTSNDSKPLLTCLVIPNVMTWTLTMLSMLPRLQNYCTSNFCLFGPGRHR